MRRINKRLLRWLPVLAALGLLICLWVISAPATGSLGIEGPCYQMLIPEARSDAVNVVWWDAPDADGGYVRYGSDAGLSDPVVAAASLTRSDQANYTAWTAEMTGLAAGSTYYYQVGHDSSWTEVQSFTAGSGSAADFSFLYFGDAQYGEYTTAQADYEAWGKLVADAAERNPQAELAVLGGDMVQQGQQPSSWQMFLAHAQALANLPALTVPGNHESNASNGKPAMYLDLMTLPHNGPAGFEEEFYSVDRGECHIQFLSSNILSNEQLLKGGMEAGDFDRIKNWIAADLAGSDATWKIVVMHHPAYAVVSDAVAAAVLEQWVPVFESEQVDLVLCGHQHVYMRSKLLHGVTYVMGVSGGKHYATSDVGFDVVQIGEVSNYQLIETDSDSLTLASFDPQGREMDSFTLSPKDRSLIPIWHDVPGDLNADDLVDEADVTILLTAIRSNTDYVDEYDFNSDGVIDIRDAQLLALRVAEGGGEG